MERLKNLPPATCENCHGACCRAGTRMPLKRKEVEFMRSNGVKLYAFLPAIPQENWKKELKGKTSDNPFEQIAIAASKDLKKGEGYYELEEDCALLVERNGLMRCAVYEDPRRPSICGEFPVGLVSCLKKRLRHGVDTPKEYSIRVELIQKRMSRIF